MPGNVRNAASVSGNFAVVKFGDRLCAGMQVAGTRVIAEPGPELEHVIERRRRELNDRREAFEEARIVGCDRLDGGLLQHDFGEPDPIRVRGLARTRAAMAARGDGRSYQASSAAGSGAVIAGGVFLAPRFHC